MKKLMLLGGSRYLLPVIDKAHELGIYTITADYLPNNIAHKYSDEYVNVSVVDKNAVLKVAEEKQIDGIMSFACDPGVITAAYVAEKMSLPHVADYKTVEILQNKDLFRKFLYENAFNVPWSYSLSDINEVQGIVSKLSWPAIVKPVDSAGSKGCTRVENEKQLNDALKRAFDYSIGNRVIIEEFIESEGDPTDCDCFSINGEMVCVTFSNQKFDAYASNPYTPAGFTFPSNMDVNYREDLICQLQKLVKILGLKTSIYNFEARVGKNHKPYIMELSPRGGGNRLAEMIRYISGLDLIEASIRAAIGLKIQEIHMPEVKGYWYEHILHANKEGVYKTTYISDDLKRYLVEKEIWVNEGECIHKYTGANETIGTIIFKFDSKLELEKITNNISEKIEVIIGENNN